MEGIQDIKKLLSTPKDVVIVSHRNPDGDALGSSLALSLFLKSMGHATKVIMPSDYPTDFFFLPELDNILVFDTEDEEAKPFIEKAHLIFCLDFNSLERIDLLGDAIAMARGTKVLIDHHLDPEPFSDYQLSEVTASSTCELMYNFFELLEMEKRVDSAIGACLMTGIITDTGSFRYATNPNVYRVASKLKEAGVDDYALQEHIFNSKNEKKLRLLGHCLANRLEVIPEYQTGIIVLNKYDYSNFDIQRGDTEGIVNYILMMRKIKVAAFITQQPKIIKFSLRSKGDISVQELVRDHFNGGGHKNAAGGHTYGSLTTAIQKFKDVLPQYVPKAV